MGGVREGVTAINGYSINIPEGNGKEDITGLQRIWPLCKLGKSLQILDMFFIFYFTSTSFAGTNHVLSTLVSFSEITKSLFTLVGEFSGF